jgi:hypothetical protein
MLNIANLGLFYVITSFIENYEVRHTYNRKLSVDVECIKINRHLLKLALQRQDIKPSN